MGSMNSKERVQAVLQGRIPDCVPTLTFGIDPIFIHKMGTHDLEKTLELLELDVYPIYSQNWCQGVPLGAGFKLNIPEEMQTSGGTYAGWDGIDEFGRVWKRGSYFGGAVKTEEDIEKYVPKLMLEKRTHPAKTKQFLEKYSDKAFALITHTGPFGLTMESIGFEEFMYMFIDNRSFIETLLWERTKWFAEIAAYGAELGADFVLMGDDVAFKGSSFISPGDFETLMLPCFSHIVNQAGIPVIWHSDGYITPLLETAVKSGFAGVHSLEPTAGVDLAEVKKNYGDQLILVGNVDCGETLCQENLDRVRGEVQRCMQQAKPGGGYMLSDSNAIHAACHPEAVKEMFRYAKEIGKY